MAALPAMRAAAHAFGRANARFAASKISRVCRLCRGDRITVVTEESVDNKALKALIAAQRAFAGAAEEAQLDPEDHADLDRLVAAVRAERRQCLSL